MTLYGRFWVTPEDLPRFRGFEGVRAFALTIGFGGKSHVYNKSPMEQYVIAALTFVVGLFTGSFFPSYMKKKGENLATHEDIDKLVEQMQAVTQATKEIEAKISNDMWDRQRRWEIKKDALFEALKELADLEASVNPLIVTHTKHSALDASPQFLLDKKDKAMNAYQEASERFLRARLLAVVVCNLELMNKFDKCQSSLVLVMTNAIRGDIDAAYEHLHESLLRIHDLAQSIGTELQGDNWKDTTLQPTGSSAVPTAKNSVAE